MSKEGIPMEPDATIVKPLEADIHDLRLSDVLTVVGQERERLEATAPRVISRHSRASSEDSKRTEPDDISIMLKLMMKTIREGHETILHRQQDILSLLQLRMYCREHMNPMHSREHSREQREAFEPIGALNAAAHPPASKQRNPVEQPCSDEGPTPVQALLHGDVIDVESSEDVTGQNSRMPWFDESTVSQNSQMSSPRSPSNMSSGAQHENSSNSIQKNKSVRDAVRGSTFTDASLALISDSWKVSIRKFVRSQRFDWFMGIVIFVNGICIGIESNRSITEARDYGDSEENASWIEHAFLTVYIVELSLRAWAADSCWTCFRNSWNRFDLICVSVGTVSLWVVPILKFVIGADNVAKGSRYMQMVLGLRILRLLRLVRALRAMSHFKMLWRLVSGLIHASGSIITTMCLLFLLVFLFGCIGVEIISKDENLYLEAEQDEVLREVLDLHFSTLPSVMLALIRFTSMDSIAAIYEPIVKAEPWLIVYFLALLLVISVTLMNLITAVLVEHSIQAAAEDREMAQIELKHRINSLIPQVNSLFKELDSNGDGTVTLEEARNAVVTINLPQELEEKVSADMLVDVHQALDEDNSGEIDREEFVEGLINMALTDVPIETTRILNQLRQQRMQTCKVEEMVQNVIMWLEEWSSHCCSQASI